MHRLFLALVPPAPIRERLLATTAGIDGARWQDDAQLHLTVRYIGPVEPREAEDVALAMEDLRAAPCEMSIAGVGRFHSGGVPTAVWAGVTPHDPLAALKQKVDGRLRRAGITPEGRRYMPHITLARLSRSAGSVEEWLAVHAGLASPAFRIDRLTLFESHLGSAGAHYEPIAEYPLS